MLGQRVARPVRARLDGGGRQLLERVAPVGELVGGPFAVEAHEHAARALAHGPPQDRPLFGREAVLDARQRGVAVAGPHLLDPDHEHGPLAGPDGELAEVDGGGAAGTAVVDVDHVRRPEPGLEQPRLTPHALLVGEQPPEGVRHHDQRQALGVDVGVGEGLVGGGAGELGGALGEPAMGRHSHAGDADIGHGCTVLVGGSPARTGSMACPLPGGGAGAADRSPPRMASRWGTGSSSATNRHRCCAPAST